ncbi:MAG: hypothetical protein U0237_07830 [Thermoleophilia bacterium]
MNNWKRWGRAAVVVVAMGGAALLSSGCVSLDGVNATQNDVVGNVEIRGTVCISGSTDCGNVDNVDSPGVTSGDVQLLLAVRVPASLTPPATVATDSPAVTFAANASYAAELERQSPAGAGRKWAGYLTNQFTYNGATDPNVAFTGTWALPQGADGSPFAGPLAYRPVVGWRISDSSHPVGRPVVCDAANLATGSDGGTTLCVDSPLLATLGDADLTRTTRDLGILTGAAASGTAGTTVTVPFTAKYAGSSTSAANFAMSAATTVPGAAVTVTPGSLLPATDSTNPVAVAVAVPAGTAPGNYDVTLTAKVGTQTRMRTGTLTVTAPVVTPPPPVVALKLSGSLPGRLTVLSARAKGVKVTIRSNRAGRAVVRLVQGGTGLAGKTVRLRKGANTVVLKSRNLVAGAYRVTVTFTATGKFTTLRGTLRAR